MLTPSPVAELPLSVQLLICTSEMLSVAVLKIPPQVAAELPLIVQLVRNACAGPSYPLLKMPPHAPVAVLPLTVQPVIVKVVSTAPWLIGFWLLLKMPAPLAAAFPKIAQLARVSVAWSLKTPPPPP